MEIIRKLFLAGVVVFRLISATEIKATTRVFTYRSAKLSKS